MARRKLTVTFNGEGKRCLTRTGFHTLRVDLFSHTLFGSRDPSERAAHPVARQEGNFWRLCQYPSEPDELFLHFDITDHEE